MASLPVVLLNVGLLNLQYSGHKTGTEQKGKKNKSNRKRELTQLKRK